MTDGDAFTVPVGIGEGKWVPVLAAWDDAPDVDVRYLIEVAWQLRRSVDAMKRMRAVAGREGWAILGQAITEGGDTLDHYTEAMTLYADGYREWAEDTIRRLKEDRAKTAPGFLTHYIRQARRWNQIAVRLRREAREIQA